MKKALRVRFSGIKDVILPEGVTQEEVDARINVITVKGEKPTPSGVGWIAHT